MRKKIRRRRCKHCDDLFTPDPRHLKRQKFCDKPECKIASKKYSQQKWLKKLKNRDYFSGSEHVIRVQQWREQNPGYWKREKSKKTPILFEHALQDTLLTKTSVGKGFQLNLMQDALQDMLSGKTFVIIGVTPHLNKTALQEIIDFTDQGTVKLVPNVLKTLIDQKKGIQYGQMLFFP
ncbi:MAG: hypothetical protein HOJ48_03505 [Desulfobacula sp.]|nr:hypothetical protein [Desulfobacula sp.]MBT7261068.1 hypothetical protein [Desulfobacula sp.]